MVRQSVMFSSKFLNFKDYDEYDVTYFAKKLNTKIS
jgi:hypothetical protein